MLCVNSLQVVNLILHFGNLKRMAELGYIMLICMMGESLSVQSFFSRQSFKDLIHMLSEQLFQPKNAIELAIVEKIFKSFMRIKNSMLFVSGLCMVACCGTASLYRSQRKLPLAAYYPFDVTVSPYYDIVYAHQSLAIIFYAFNNVFGFAISSMFAHFLGLQCDLLCQRVTRIGKNGSDIRQEFLECIRHHRLILKFLKTTEKVFGKIYFGQLFASTTALCMDLFLLSLTEPKTFEFFYLVVYLLAVANLLLVPCWFSTEMTRKSENIPFAAYSCDWVDSSNSFKKELIFFIRRAQRPLKFYAVDFFEISVETFVKIIRTSLSYYAVLNNLNMEEKYY
ncbi:odorant receptor 4-like isoform X6 [Cylas formicarius]|uniref:odorant receptor 4-like isoform X6 n=1 Tax=Cylas formicarius TaxID=197179 RepID=UPI002958DC73|nr:odorant receptor 4-like isoform X6 [Cylas formicarius]